MARSSSSITGAGANAHSEMLPGSAAPSAASSRSACASCCTNMLNPCVRSSTRRRAARFLRGAARSLATVRRVAWMVLAKVSTAPGDLACAAELMMGGGFGRKQGDCTRGACVACKYRARRAQRLYSRSQSGKVGPGAPARTSPPCKPLMARGVCGGGSAHVLMLGARSSRCDVEWAHI